MSRPASLGWRLGVSVALVVALASALLGAALYRSFEQQLLRRDDVQLLGKLRQLRQLLGHSGTPELLRSQADYLRDTMSGESNALIEIRTDAAGGSRVLLAINPPGLPLLQTPPLPVQQEPRLEDLSHWATPAGVPAAGLNAWGLLGAQRVEIRLARLYPERRALLAEYRWRIAGSSLAAGGVAAALALALVWRGLAPLRRLREQAAAIGPQSLSQRLAVADVPGEVRLLVDGVNTMLARLEQGYAQLHQFSADLAHELRTPLATLTGQTQVALSRAREPAAYAQLLEEQLQELERLNRMVDSLLFLARSEHEALSGRLQRQPLSAAAELARQADYFADLAEERALRLRCEGDAPLWAEPAMLRRALANLVANAVRHARPGSEITLSAATEPGALGALTVLTVANEGEPVPAEVLPRLFDRFYRADASREGSAGGSGLGLALVRAILALHGGTADVQAGEGGRIAFVLRWPSAPEAAGSRAGEG